MPTIEDRADPAQKLSTTPPLNTGDTRVGTSAATAVAAGKSAERTVAAMRVEHLGFGPDYVDYLQAWDHQRQVHAKVVSGERGEAARVRCTPG